MQITRHTVPGVGELHDGVTRAGHHLRVLVDRSGERHLFVYSPSDEVITITLETDEADRLAELLHTAPLPDRMAALERRVRELAGRTR
jgi:TrkA domain protein